MAKIIGAKAHAARLKKIQGPEMVKAVGAALFVAGDMIKVDAQISVTAGSVSGKGHVVSAPGDPPNNDSGDLVRGIENTQVAPLRVEVTSSAPHAVPLEVGTSKMAARPYMGPAAQKNRAEATQLVREAVSRVVKAAGPM
jgi:HK97 gp10 family phage protein